MPRALGAAVRLAAAIGLLALALPAAAQDYPSKPVRLVVPQTPGGATDVLARAFGQKLQERWGQPVVVENRAGAAGIVGTDFVAKAPADGYTLLLTYAGSQAVNQSLYPKVPYDAVKDFETVATIAVMPFILVVGPQSPYRDVKALVAAARAKPDAVTYASSGNGSVNHLLGEMVKTETGVKMLHIPYKGVAPSLTDVIAGQVDSAFGSVPSVIQHIQKGTLRALAVSSAARSPAAPDVPTLAETVVPGFDVNPWWGILAPAGTPAAVVAKINADVNGLLAQKENQDFLRSQGATALATSPPQFRAILEADVVKWAKVVKDSGARID
ncbi:MAG: tripartite tricarboxylate transporter substrate binding protein [Alphaproteobacteria bacterium]